MGNARIPYLGSLSFDPVGNGWVYYDSGPMYTSNDLRSWSPVLTPPAASLGDTGGLISWASSGSLFYVSKLPDGGDSSYWIADFAD